MHNVSWQNYYDIFQAQAKRLLQDHQHNNVVPEELQQREIELLKKTLHYEKFFFVISNTMFITTHVHGVDRLLGYTNDFFTIKKYYSIIHPSHLIAQMTSNYELLESCIAGKWPVKFMSHRFINTLALRHANGEYYLFKRLAWPFEHDGNFRMLSYLNEYTLLGPYNNEPSSVRISDASGNLSDWNSELLTRTKISFEKQTQFSQQELRVLSLYAHNPSINTSEIARLFNIKENTVITYKRRILYKAENLFHQKFDTTKTAAAYIKEHGLI